MSLIRISRGIPKYNIQIGPIKQALTHNPSAILSVTDYFEEDNNHFPTYHWIPINESAKSWGYMPFFATKRILDHWCSNLNLSYVYLGCSAGEHRSPMVAFCWLLSQPGATPESVAKEFFGGFKFNLLEKYYEDVRLGYIPNDLQSFYQLMRAFPTCDYQRILLNLCKTEIITNPS